MKIKMKFLSIMQVASVFQMLALSAVFAGSVEQSVESLSTPELKVFFVNQHGDTNISGDQSIFWGIQSTSNAQVTVFIPSDDSFAYQVELTDHSGNPVAKTSVGRRIGSKFQEFDPNSKEIRFIRYVATKQSAPTIPLLSPSTAFRMSDANKYLLNVKLQMVMPINRGTNHLGYKVLKLSHSLSITVPDHVRHGGP